MLGWVLQRVHLPLCWCSSCAGRESDEFTSLGALEGPGPQRDVPQAKTMARGPEHPEKVLLRGLHWAFFQSLLGPPLPCMAHGTLMSTTYEPHILLHMPSVGPCLICFVSFSWVSTKHKVWLPGSVTVCCINFCTAKLRLVSGSLEVRLWSF